MPTETGNVDAIAGTIVDQWSGKPWPVQAGGQLSVDVTGLQSEDQVLARAAVETWGHYTGLRFTETVGNADITFTHAGAQGAYTQAYWSGGAAVEATVYVSADWTDRSDGGGSGVADLPYSYYTYLHEFGHALGLGHPGTYDRGSDFEREAVHANDSWQVSVMSYFSQEENPNVAANDAVPLTPMAADLEAIARLYGEAEIAPGNTTYFANSTAPGAIAERLDLIGSGTATLADSSGRDTLDLSGFGADQAVTLKAGIASDVAGGRGNLVIAPETRIENAIGGTGDDALHGNGGSNRLVGGAGNDLLSGYRGDDRLWAGGQDNGADTLYGGSGADILGGGAGADMLNGGPGRDIAYGGGGDDEIRAAETAWAGWGRDLVQGGGARDTLGGGGDADTVVGGGNRDTLYGGGGDDELIGQWGADVVYAGDGADRVLGNAQDDLLFNGRGDDTVYGGNGRDEIWGGAGNDELHGGPDADVFAFARGNGRDTVMDFEVNADSLRFDGPGGMGALDISQQGAATRIDFAGTTILLEDVSASAVTGDMIDFL